MGAPISRSMCCSIREKAFKLCQGSMDMETCGAVCLRVEGTHCSCFAVWRQDGQSHGLSPDAPEFSQAEVGSLATAGVIGTSLIFVGFNTRLWCKCNAQAEITLAEPRFIAFVPSRVQLHTCLWQCHQLL